MKKLLINVLLIALVGGLFACRSATQKAVEEFGIISTDELNQGIQEKSLLVFDNNSPGLYQKKHIPTAIFMDYGNPDPGLLPEEKNTLLVFYCKNERCTASHEGARFARSQGYPNVKIYPLGIDGWVEAGMPVESGH